MSKLIKLYTLNMVRFLCIIHALLQSYKNKKKASCEGKVEDNSFSIFVNTKVLFTKTVFAGGRRDKFGSWD